MPTPLSESALVSAGQIRTLGPKTDLNVLDVREADWVKPKCQANRAQVAADLNLLAQNGNIEAYKSFLTYLPCNVEARRMPADHWDVLANGNEDARVVVWPGVDSPIGKVDLRREKALSATPGLKNERPERLVFVKIDIGNGEYVPEEVAWALQAAFIDGLVTRLVLGGYAEDFQDGKIPSPGVVNLKFPPGTFEVSATWNPPTYIEAIAAVAQKQPLQGRVMLYGWTLGDIIATEGTPEEKDAVWRLLGNRLDVRGLGEAMGYTLSYLEGWRQSIEILESQKIDRNTGKPNATIKETLDTLAQVSFDHAVRLAAERVHVADGQFSAAAINASIFDLMINAHESRNEQHKLTPFLQGYNLGSIRSAEAVYADVFLLAYGIGYSDGFRDGYSKGYAEGYRAGYDDGYNQNFFNQLVTISSNIASTASSVASVVKTIGSIVALF